MGILVFLKINLSIPVIDTHPRRVTLALYTFIASSTALPTKVVISLFNKSNTLAGNI